jgi:hypothetical protein
MAAHTLVALRLPGAASFCRSEIHPLPPLLGCMFAFIHLPSYCLVFIAEKYELTTQLARNYNSYNH